MTSGPADCFIGLEITRDYKQSRIYVTQSCYIRKLLERFRMTECNHSKVPADTYSRLTKTSQSNEKSENTDTTAYRALIGGLLYAMGMTRPGIAFSVIVTTVKIQGNLTGKPRNSSWPISPERSITACASPEVIQQTYSSATQTPTSLDAQKRAAQPVVYYLFSTVDQ